MKENFVTKTLDALLEVVDLEFKIPLGFAEIKFPVTPHAKEWWKNKKSRVEVENAIRRAEESFIASHPTEKLAQILHDFPLYAESDYKKVILELLTHLDEEKITWLAEIKLENEWDKLISKEEIQSSLRLYLPFLRYELNKIDAFREIITARAIERIEKDVQQIRNTQDDFNRRFQNFEDLSFHQSELLLKHMMGISSQIAIQGLELSHPDDVTLPPSIFLQRDELIKGLQKDLENTTCLFLVDGSGKGKTQLAVSLYELWSGASKYWITLRNKGELQDRHLRIQVIRWLCQVSGELSYWQRYLAGDITFREVITILGEFLKDGGMLVIDDFPNPVDFENLYNDLEIITKAFSKYGSKIVATGQWEIPPHLGSRFPSLISTRSCPSFSLEEILELLGIVQIPSELQTEKIATLISATTKGHPSLVSATLSWLVKRGQGFRFETLDDLFSGEPVKDTLEYSRKVLIKTLDDQPKELLYRLSLVGEKFDKKLIKEIANISPAIVNPEEQLDKLVGPWIDRLDGEHFDVSPLLSKVGENNIPVDLFKKTHALCADRYLRTHTINISSLLTIISHLWQAQDYLRFANVLVVALMSVKTYEQAKYVDWACSLLLDINWPSEISLHWRIIIRSAQLRVLALAKGNYNRILNDLEKLMVGTDIEEDAPALILASLTIGFFVERLPVTTVISYSFSATQLIHSFSKREKEGFIVGIETHGPNMLWVNSFRIKDYDDIKLFLDKVDKLDQDIKESLYIAPLAVEASSRLIDQIWLRELEKPQQEHNWHKVLSEINQLEKFLCIQESECLRLAVARANAVVYADYLKQREYAITILDGILETNSSEAYFLINYSKGCFALDSGDYLATVKFLTVADDAKGEGFEYYRFATTKLLTIALEWQNDWDLAKKYCLKAIHNFRKHGSNTEILEFCELLGELAYIHWASGTPKKACGAMYGYIRELTRYEDVEDLHYKEVFNKGGHALGWFSSMSQVGVPPEKTPSGDEYAPVQPGLFGIRRKKLGEHTTSIGFSVSHLMRQQALFAEGVSAIRMSREILKMSLERSIIEENNNNAFSQFTYVSLTTLETILGSPSQALQYGLQARKFYSTTNVVGNNSTQFNNWDNSALTPKFTTTSNEAYQKSEEKLVYAIFVPLFAKLIGSNLSTIEMLAELDKWNNEVMALKSELLLFEDWTDLIQYLKELILFWKEEGDASKEPVLFRDTSFFEVLKMLLNSEMPKVGLNDAYILQVRVAISLPNFGSYAKHLFPWIGRFVHRYWLITVQNRRFALHSPSLFLDELTSISPYEGANTLYEVLIGAGRALGINLPDDVKMQMKKMKKMAKPWLEV